MTTTNPSPPSHSAQTAARAALASPFGAKGGSPAGAANGLNFAALLQADEPSEVGPQSLALASAEGDDALTPPDARPTDAAAASSAAEWLMAGWMPWQGAVPPAAGSGSASGPAAGAGVAALPGGMGLKPNGLTTEGAPTNLNLPANGSPAALAATPGGMDATGLTMGAAANAASRSTRGAVPRDPQDPLAFGLPDGQRAGASAEAQAANPIGTSTGAASTARAGETAGAKFSADAMAGPLSNRKGPARGAVTTQSLQTSTAAASATAPGAMAASMVQSARSTVAWVGQGRSDWAVRAAEATADAPSALDGVADALNPAEPFNRLGATEAGPRSEGAAGIEPSGADRPAVAEAATSLPESAAEAMAEAMEDLAGQLAYWAQQGTQRAQLTLDKGFDAPLLVSVVLDKGEVHVNLETDDPAIRAALDEQAASLLERLLDRNGLTLGNLTVETGAAQSNGNGQMTGNGQTAEGRQPQDTLTMGARTAARQAASDTPAPTAAPLSSPRATSNHRLDLFA